MVIQHPETVFEFVEMVTYRPLAQLSIWDEGQSNVSMSTLDGFYLGSATREEIARAWWAWERRHGG